MTRSGLRRGDPGASGFMACEVDSI